jgi:hypothetical protein
MEQRFSAETERAATLVRATLAEWPSNAMSVEDRAPTIDDSDDYVVEREIVIKPSDSSACPIDIWFVASGKELPYIALGFDRWIHLASRVGATSTNRRFVFGFEPITVTASQLRAMLVAVLRGHAQATYSTVFRRLISARGHLLTQVGIPGLELAHRGKKYRYNAYAA